MRVRGAQPDGSRSTFEFEFEFETMVDYLDSCRVARTYWPERLELVDSLPRTPSGKIQKFVLRARARELVADDHRRMTTAATTPAA